MSRPRLTRVPNAVVELLRLVVVVFCAALGYELGSVLSSGASVLGPFNALWLGVIIGSFLGYVLGGVVARSTYAAVSRTEQSLRAVSAEEIVAGVFGAIIGVLVGGAMAWPVFFLGQLDLSVPLFGFVVITMGLLGYRVGTNRREAMLHMFGAKAGMGPVVAASSSLPRVVDSSVAVDGRVLDVVRAGFLHGRMLVPLPVVTELQGLADAGDDLRRHKGRRGLEVLEALKREPGVTVEVVEDEVPAVPEVDAKLVRLCLDHGAALLTLDTNLAKAAALAGVQVMNMHALTLALRPLVTAGDEVAVLLLKPGKEPGQAVGYLDDGTMVVVERSRERIGHEATVQVTSVLTTANGRMVFGRPAAADVPAEPEPAHR